MHQKLTLSIENFGGIATATMDFHPGLTLLAGNNGASKSTILRAIVACAGADTVIPLVKDGKDAIMKKDSHLLVRGKSGSATLTGGNGSRRVVWPSNGMKGGGPFIPAPSRMALGLVDWMGAPKVERLKMMMDAAAKDPSISTEITREDLEQAATDEHIDPDMIGWAWQVISNNGFDAANLEASKYMTEATGGWRATTKESYGAEKARSYFPMGWGPDLATVSKENLLQDIQIARKDVDHAIANQAVNAAEIARVESIATAPMPDISGLQKNLDDARNTRVLEIAELQKLLEERVNHEPQEIIDARVALATNKNQIDAIQKKIAAMRSGVPRIDGHCPGCAIPLSIHDAGVGSGTKRYQLSHPNGNEVDQTQIDALEQEIANLHEEISKNNTFISESTKTAANQIRDIRAKLETEQATQRNAIRTAENLFNTAKRQADEINGAKLELAEIQLKSGDITAEQLVFLRQDLARAEARLQAWETKVNADRYAEDARQFGVLRAITAPGGIRKAKMDNALVGLNNRCAELSEIAKWGTVSLTSDADFQYEGRPYVICSRAEQYRCRVTVQMVLSVLENSPILLCDDTDVLDSNGRMGLVNMLRSTSIPTTIIAMTAKRDYAEAIAKLFDTTYWVESGIVNDISYSSD
ncbi:MAG: AAA family ATPase [Magnetococcales bacterium]|nr:AAA family ATPase [Magnetococcales bacterium]